MDISLISILLRVSAILPRVTPRWVQNWYKTSKLTQFSIFAASEQKTTNSKKP